MENTTRIAVWNGLVIGAGVGLTWNSQIRIATENSVFALPETAIGTFAGLGIGYFLTRINKGDPSFGLYVGLTGKKIKSKELVKCGIATHFVRSDKLPSLYEALIC